MDNYLTNMKEATNLLDELGISLSEPIVVYYIVKNLPREFHIQKQMVLFKDVLPRCLELESKLLAQDLTKKIDHRKEKKGKVFVVH